MFRVLALLFLLAAGAASAASEEDYRAGAAAFRSGDVVRAMALLRKSADAGHAPSQSLLAYILDKAEFNEEAVAYYRKAAAQSDAEGEFGLGSMYAAGEGTARDLGEARKWITRAAEKGHEPAVKVIALAYIKGGLGVTEAERGTAEALRWIRRAADAGDVPAMEELATAYRTGAYGLTIDQKQAQAIESKVRGARGAPEKSTTRRRERR